MGVGLETLVGWFGPGGGLAIAILIAGSIAGKKIIFKQLAAIAELQKQLVEKELACAEEILRVKLEGEREKHLYREKLDEINRTERDVYRARDDQKRADNIGLFLKYDNMLERVMTALQGLGNAVTELRFEVTRNHR